MSKRNDKAWAKFMAIVSAALLLASPAAAQTGGTGNAATAPLTPVAPAAATAVKGWLFGLQYNSTQPTFTNGQQGSAQGTARGALIVAPGVEGFAVTGTFSLPANAAQETGGNLATIVARTPALGAAAKAASTPVVLPTDPDTRPSSGTITIQDTGSASASGQDSVSIITGSPTASSTQSAAINGQGTIGVQLSGTWTGTITTEQSRDGGATWETMPCHVNGAVYSRTAFTGNGMFNCIAAAATNIRARATAVMTGTATVLFTASSTPGYHEIINSVSWKDNASGAQATVKPASTAALSTDTGVVVNLNPNSPLGAGTAVIGKTGIDQTTPGTTNAVQGIPGTSGGLSVYFVQPAASDNHANIKNGAGQVYKVSVTNNSATINYLRLYDAGTGFNGCNSATNLKYKMAIPASASSSGAGYSDSWESGIAFATGISICVSSGYATTDTTNATASAIDVNVGYK